MDAVTSYSTDSSLAGAACFDTCRANKQPKRPLPTKSPQGQDKVDTYLQLSGARGTRQQRDPLLMSKPLVQTYVTAPQLFQDLPLKFFKMDQHRRKRPHSEHRKDHTLRGRDAYRDRPHAEREPSLEPPQPNATSAETTHKPASKPRARKRAHNHAQRPHSSYQPAPTHPSSWSSAPRRAPSPILFKGESSSLSGPFPKPPVKCNVLTSSPLDDPHQWTSPPAARSTAITHMPPKPLSPAYEPYTQLVAPSPPPPVIQVPTGSLKPAHMISLGKEADVLHVQQLPSRMDSPMLPRVTRSSSCHGTRPPLNLPIAVPSAHNPSHITSRSASGFNPASTFVKPPENSYTPTALSSPGDIISRPEYTQKYMFQPDKSVYAVQSDASQTRQDLDFTVRPSPSIFRLPSTTIQSNSAVSLSAVSPPEYPPWSQASWSHASWTRSKRLSTCTKAQPSRTAAEALHPFVKSDSLSPSDAPQRIWPSHETPPGPRPSTSPPAPSSLPQPVVSGLSQPPRPSFSPIHRPSTSHRLQASAETSPSSPIVRHDWYPESVPASARPLSPPVIDLFRESEDRSVLATERDMLPPLHLGSTGTHLVPSTPLNTASRSDALKGFLRLNLSRAVEGNIAATESFMQRAVHTRTHSLHAPGGNRLPCPPQLTLSDPLLPVDSQAASPAPALSPSPSTSMEDEMEATDAPTLPGESKNLDWSNHSKALSTGDVAASRPHRSSKSSHIFLYSPRKPRRPADAPVLSVTPTTRTPTHRDSPKSIQSTTVGPPSSPTMKPVQSSPRSTKRSQSSRAPRCVEVGVQVDLKVARLRSASSGPAADRKSNESSQVRDITSTDEPSGLSRLVEKQSKDAERGAKPSRDTTSEKPSASTSFPDEYVCPFCCCCRGHNTHSTSMEPATTPHSTPYPSSRLKDLSDLPAVGDVRGMGEAISLVPTLTYRLSENSVLLQQQSSSPDLPSTGIQDVASQESDAWSESPWQTARLVPQPDSKVVKEDSPTSHSVATPTSNGSSVVRIRTDEAFADNDDDDFVTDEPLADATSAEADDDDTSSEGSAQRMSPTYGMRLESFDLSATKDAETISAELLEEDLGNRLMNSYSTSSGRSNPYHVPPLKLPTLPSPNSAPLLTPPDAPEAIDDNNKVDTPTTHRLTGRLRHVVEQVRRRRSSVGGSSSDSRTPRSAGRALVRPIGETDKPVEKDESHVIPVEAIMPSKAVAEESSSPTESVVTTAPAQDPDNVEGLKLEITGTEMTKTVAPAHVILLDADDTLIPTTEFCEEKYLDRELNELPADFQAQLDLLDNHLTALFEKLHAMVVLENFGLMSPTHSKNYVLSVVIITNATLSHIQTTFVKFLPKLSKFLDSRSIKIEELVCSARDIWSDEFPFEHFYEFWKAWTLEDILKELKTDGVPGVTVFSIGDDEPERKAAAYVEAEMSDFVKGLKIIKMYQQPKTPQLSKQLEYVNANIRRLIEMPQGFDLKLDIVPINASPNASPNNDQGTPDNSIVAASTDAAEPQQPEESPQEITLFSNEDLSDYQVVEVTQLHPPEIPDRIEALFIQFELKYETLFDSLRTMTRGDANQFIRAMEQSRERADLATFADECRQFLSLFHAFSIVAHKDTSPSVGDADGVLGLFPEELPAETLQSVANALIRSEMADHSESEEGVEGSDGRIPHEPDANSVRQTLDELHSPGLILHALQSTVKFLLQYPNLMTTLPNLGWSPPSQEEFIVVAVKLFLTGWYANSDSVNGGNSNRHA